MVQGIARASLHMSFIVAAISLFVALKPGLVLSAETGRQAAVDDFHLASSPAELALDGVITLAQVDDDIIGFARGLEDRDRRKDEKFARYFSLALVTAWRAAERAAVEKNCAGRYVAGDICGIEVNPITCTTDLNEGGYVYATEKTDGDTAVISYRWPQFPDLVATYRMARAGHRWFLDGVSCRSYLRFNME